MKYLISFIFLFNFFLLAAQNDDFIYERNKFAFEIYNQIIDNKENQIFSPYFFDFSLSEIYLATKGGTSRQVKEFAGFNDDKNQHFKDFLEYQKIITGNHSVTNDIKYSINMFIEDSLKILDDFKQKIAPTILDSVRSIDFTADKVTIAEKLNEIIEKNTQNRISGYFTADDIADSSNIIISSSAFFTGHWANNFENYVYQPFILDSLGKTIANVRFLTTSNYFKYGEGDNYQIIEIPYEGYRYSLILILPKNVKKLAEFEDIFNYDNYQLWRKNSLQGQSVRLLMPEFEVENFYNLTSRYDTVTPAIYQKGGNFLNLIKKVVFITGFYHYAKFTVEQETQNITELKPSYLRKEQKEEGILVFNANHPFIFLVIDRKTQAILFIGHYYQPPQNND